MHIKWDGGDKVICNVASGRADNAGVKEPKAYERLASSQVNMHIDIGSGSKFSAVPSKGILSL